MPSHPWGLHVRVFVFVSLTLGFEVSRAQGEIAVSETEIAPHVLVFATGSGNVVASVGLDGAFLVGTPSAASTAQINGILEGRTKSDVRYVVIAAEDPAESEGDAGWGRRGAFVAMQEKALERWGGHRMGAARPLPPRLIQLGVDRPRVAFSEVLTFDLNGDAIHVVHQSAGCSDADFVAHFHAANLVYLGAAFPGDGYPNIHLDEGGSLDGLLRMLSPWTDESRRVVPERGKVMNGAYVKAFRDMLMAVRDRVKGLIDAGQSEQEVMAAHPTAAFDARWGHGRVRTDEFVRTVYAGLNPGQR